MFCRVSSLKRLWERKKKRWQTDRQTDSFVCIHPCEVPPNPHDGLLLLALLFLCSFFFFFFFFAVPMMRFVVAFSHWTETKISLSPWMCDVTIIIVMFGKGRGFGLAVDLHTHDVWMKGVELAWRACDVTLGSSAHSGAAPGRCLAGSCRVFLLEGYFFSR